MRLVDGRATVTGIPAHRDVENRGYHDRADSRRWTQVLGISRRSGRCAQRRRGRHSGGIVNPHIRKIADRFASRGYVAIAPSLFDCVKPGVELGYDENSLSEGLALMQQVGTERSLGDIQATVDAVKSAGKVAIVGYCWGGYLAYMSGNRVTGAACAIGYYGGGIVDEYREKRKIPTLLHFAENDPLIPFEEVSQFRAHRPDVSAFSYPSVGHSHVSNS
jgi:carboxymethylenebutenolidase